MKSTNDQKLFPWFKMRVSFPEAFATFEDEKKSDFIPFLTEPSINEKPMNLVEHKEKMWLLCVYDIEENKRGCVWYAYDKKWVEVNFA